MASGKNDELLQQIREASGYNYMSDLRAAALNEKGCSFIREVAPNSYTLSEWNEAAAYITDRDCTCQNINAAKEKIISANKK